MNFWLLQWQDLWWYLPMSVQMLMTIYVWTWPFRSLTCVKTTALPTHFVHDSVAPVVRYNCNLIMKMLWYLHHLYLYFLIFSVKDFYLFAEFMEHTNKILQPIAIVSHQRCTFSSCYRINRDFQISKHHLISRREY